MSFLKKLFLTKSREVAVRDNIAKTKAALSRIEIFTLELEKNDIEMKAHERLFTLATNDLDYPLWIKDRDSRFFFMNTACIEQILRTTLDAASLLTDEDFEHDALAQVCMRSDKIVVETGLTYRGIEHARYDDGTDVWIDTTKSPLILEDNIVGTVGFGKDITDKVPEDIRERYKEPEGIEIPLDIIYNSDDIRKLVENARN